MNSTTVLQGSEKQIAWAQDIIATVEARAETLISEKVAAMIEQLPAPLRPVMAPRMETIGAERRAKVAAFIASHTDARYWIERMTNSSIQDREWLYNAIATSILAE